jgi:hypothetical protein
MPLRANPTPSPQSNNDAKKTQFETEMLKKIPGTDILKYNKVVITNRDGINVWVIYEYDGSGYKIYKHDLSVDANNLLDKPSQHSEQNFLPPENDGSGGAPDGGVEPRQYYSSTNLNINSPPDFSSSGEGATWHNKNSSTAGWMGGRRRRSRKSKKSRKSYKKSYKKSKKSKKSRRYRR